MKILKIIAGAIAAIFIVYLLIGVFVPTVNYTTEVEVNKSLKESWGVFSDESKVNDWVTGITSMELLEGTKGTVGAKTKLNMEQNGEPFDLIEEILEVKKEEKCAIKYDNEMMTQNVDINFSAKDENTTVIKVNSTVEGKGMMVKPMFAFMKGSIKKVSDGMYGRLKELIENNTTDYFQMESAIDTTEAINEPVPETESENNSNNEDGISETSAPVPVSNPSTTTTTTTATPTEENPSFSKMSSEEMKMVAEINFVRTRPKEYAKHIEAFKREQVAQNRMDWAATCDELIKELKSMPPVSKLEPSNCVYEAAKKHGIEQKTTNSIDHKGKNGSLPWDRVKQACPDMATGGENLVSGSRDIRNSVILLLVDHGISNRGIAGRCWTRIGNMSPAIIWGNSGLIQNIGFRILENKS